MKLFICYLVAGWGLVTATSLPVYPEVQIFRAERNMIVAAHLDELKQMLAKAAKACGSNIDNVFGSRDQTSELDMIIFKSRVLAWFNEADLNTREAIEESLFLFMSVRSKAHGIALMRSLDSSFTETLAAQPIVVANIRQLIAQTVAPLRRALSEYNRAYRRGVESMAYARTQLALRAAQWDQLKGNEFRLMEFLNIRYGGLPEAPFPTGDLGLVRLNNEFSEGLASLNPQLLASVRGYFPDSLSSEALWFELVEFVEQQALPESTVGALLFRELRRSISIQEQVIFDAQGAFEKKRVAEENVLHTAETHSFRLQQIINQISTDPLVT